MSTSDAAIGRWLVERLAEAKHCVAAWLDEIRMALAGDYDEPLTHETAALPAAEPPAHVR